MATFKTNLKLTLLDEFTPGMSKVINKANMADKRFAKLGRTMGNMGNRLNAVSGGMKSFGATMTASLTLPIIAAGTAALKQAANFEALQISLQTMTRDVAKGNALFDELIQFSRVTPFTPEQVGRAGKVLLAFGVQAEEVKGILNEIGDVSAGTGKNLAEMAVIFGQIKSAGRLMGQDLLQLINAGFNPLQVISEKTGRSMADLKKDMENGLISFEEVHAAFKIATSEGGTFNNMMGKLSTTITGLTSTLLGDIQLALKSIGEEIKEVFDLENLIPKIGQQITKLVTAFKSLRPETKKMVIIGAALAAIVPPIVLALGALVGVVGMAISGFAVLAPVIGAISLPVVAVVAAIGALVAIWTVGLVKSEKFRASIIRWGQAISNIAKPVIALFRVFARLLNIQGSNGSPIDFFDGLAFVINKVAIAVELMLAPLKAAADILNSIADDGLGALNLDNLGNILQSNLDDNIRLGQELIGRSPNENFTNLNNNNVEVKNNINVEANGNVTAQTSVNGKAQSSSLGGMVPSIAGI